MKTHFPLIEEEEEEEDAFSGSELTNKADCWAPSKACAFLTGNSFFFPVDFGEEGD